MPNGGADNCGACKFNMKNNEGYIGRDCCKIRNIHISSPYWTYCANWKRIGMDNIDFYGKDYGEEPYGPPYASGIYEGYIRIPWCGEGEPEVYVSGKCEVCGREFYKNGISVLHKEEKKEFCSNSHYFKWWKQNFIGIPLIFDYADSDDEDKSINLHKVYTEIYRSGYLKTDFIHRGEDKNFLPINSDLDILLNRIEGALLGGAVGDALGSIVEGLTPGSYWIEEYKRSGWKKGPLGTVTDDTQMTMWTAQSLLDNGGLNPNELAKKFTSGHIVGIGSSTRSFLRNYRDKKLPWYESGVDSAGNGAAMRSIPLGIYFRNDFDELKLASGIQAFITHNNSMAIASSILVSYVAAKLLRMDPLMLKSIDDRIEFCRDIAGVISGIEKEDEYRTRDTNEIDSLYKRLYYTLPELLNRNITPNEVSSVLLSGVYVLESLPFALYCFLYSPDNYKETLKSAVNYSVDSDTTASIACSFSGILNGIDNIDKYYLDELEYREELLILSEKLLLR